MAKIWDYESNDNDKLAQKVLKDNSIVMTKPTMAKHLIELIEVEDGEIWLEPARGDGGFYDNFPKNVVPCFCEINEGTDFLQYDESQKVDVIISNPPFVPRKLFWDFMVKSMKVARKNIYWLINISSINVFTPKRLLQMKSENWFIQKMHIVSDARWFGRYAFIKIGKDDYDFLTWNGKSF